MSADAPTVAIVDYDAGNLRSVQKALEKFGARAEIASSADRVARADALVVPGQGACDSSMRRLRELGLVAPIRAYINDGKPFLGVCLGLQLLLDSSDEGEEPCLGVIPGACHRLPDGGSGGLNDGRKIPHMGWNQVEWRKEHPFFAGVPNGSHFYFVHSYYAAPDDSSVVAGVTDYGVEFCSAAAWGSAAAVQFHPEKSGRIGLRIYENFVRHVRQTRQAKGGGAWK